MMRKNHAGFSLIEILAAFSIAAVALAILFQIYSKGTRSALLGHDYARAIQIAQSRLDTVGIVNDVDTSATTGTDLDKFRWEVRVEDFEPAEEADLESPLELRSVFVTVRWDTAGKNYSVNLQSLKPVTDSL